MKRILLVMLLSVAVLSLSGCSRFVLDARDLGEPISMTKNVGDAEVQTQSTPFETSTKVGYCGWVFNLVTLKNADLSSMLEIEMKAVGGVSVRNVRVKKEKSFVDGLISIVTLGFYNPETITIKGEVVSK